MKIGTVNGKNVKMSKSETERRTTMDRVIISNEVKKLKHCTETIETAVIGNYKIVKVCVADGDFYGEQISVTPQKDYLPGITWNERSNRWEIHSNPFYLEKYYDGIETDFETYIKDTKEVIETARLIEVYYGKATNK